jgi:hypothetical protein
MSYQLRIRDGCRLNRDPSPVSMVCCSGVDALRPEPVPHVPIPTTRDNQPRPEKGQRRGPRPGAATRLLLPESAKGHGRQSIAEGQCLPAEVRERAGVRDVDLRGLQLTARQGPSAPIGMTMMPSSRR